MNESDSRLSKRVRTLWSSGVLRHHDFAALWLAQSVSILGTQLTAVATAVLGMQLAGGSALVFTLVLAASIVPVILFSWVAGVLVDRWDKRTVMVVADVARGLLMLVLVVVRVPWQGLAAVAFAVAAFTAFFEPALMGLVPQTVPDEELLPANSLTQSTSSLLNIAGFGLAGVVLATLGPRPAFLVDAISYFISAAALLTVRVRTAADQGAAGGFWAELKDGVRYHLENRPVLDLLILIVGLTLGIGIYNAMTTMAVERLLGRPESDWGYLMAVASLATTVTGIWMGRNGERYNRLTLLAGSYILMALVSIGFAFNRIFILAVVLAALEGAINGVQFIAMTTWVQQVVSKDRLGRVFSVRFTFGNVSILLSTVLSGYLADRFGVDRMLLVAGGVFLLWGLMTAGMRSLRESSRELSRRATGGSTAEEVQPQAG